MSKKEERKTLIYEFIKSYMKEKNYPPSFREICDGAGLVSTSTLQSYLAEMVKEGLLTTKGEGSSRTLIVKGARYVFDD